MEDDGVMVLECGSRYTTRDKSTLQITLESRSFLSSKLIYRGASKEERVNINSN